MRERRKVSIVRALPVIVRGESGQFGGVIGACCVAYCVRVIGWICNYM